MANDGIYVAELAIVNIRLPLIRGETAYIAVGHSDKDLDDIIAVKISTQTGVHGPKFRRIIRLIHHGS